MSIRTTTPPHIVKALREVRNPSRGCKAAMLKGTIDQHAYMQWGEDLRTGTLWGALLSAESYEQSGGNYVPGTVAAALAASLTKGVLKRAAWWETELASLRTNVVAKTEAPVVKKAIDLYKKAHPEADVIPDPAMLAVVQQVLDAVANGTWTDEMRQTLTKQMQEGDWNGCHTDELATGDGMPIHTAESIIAVHIEWAWGGGTMMKS